MATKRSPGGLCYRVRHSQNALTKALSPLPFPAFSPPPLLQSDEPPPAGYTKYLTGCMYLACLQALTADHTCANFT